MSSQTDTSASALMSAEGAGLTEGEGGGNVFVADAERPSAPRRSGQKRTDGDSEAITIELSAAQVDRVVRDAADGGNMSVLLSGLKDVRAVLAQEPRRARGQPALALAARRPADACLVSDRRQLSRKR